MLKTPRLIAAGWYFTHFKKVFRKNGLVIHVPFELTDYKFRGRFVLGTYEKEEATYLEKYLKSDACVLELGSCLGYVSCLTNQLLKDKTKHVVLEANPHLIPWIQKNKDANACSFAIENSIVSNNVSNTFYLHHLIVGGSNKRKTAHKIDVNGVEIASLEAKYGLQFDTLVMDIEGGELELFRTQKKSIGAFRMIFMEVHPFAGILTDEEALECEEILQSLGFQNILKDGNFQIWEKE